MSEVLLKVDNVGKRFCRSLKRSLWYGLQDVGSEFRGRSHGGAVRLPQSSADVQLRQDEFWAVKDVSFELRRGECLGLIGRNGAGKTTLLRLLNGLIKPDAGTIESKGLIGALIALGSGFNPILSGRENIYVGGSVLGLNSDEIDQKLDEIIEFAEIREFIDSPVQSYSSGMQARLGFAVASSLNQDILLIDEILSVGDASFRAKCYKRLALMKESGCSFIFVSHTPLAIQQICDTGLYMEKGRQVYIGSVNNCLNRYLLQERIKPSQPAKSIFKIPQQELLVDKVPCITSLKVDSLLKFGDRFAAEFEVAGIEHFVGGHYPLWLQVYLRKTQGEFAEFTFECQLEEYGLQPHGKYTILLACKHLLLPPSEYSLKGSIVVKKPKQIIFSTDNLPVNIIDNGIELEGSLISSIKESFHFSLANA